MSLTRKLFKAALIKYRQAEQKEPIWFWVNPSSGTTLSPHFENQGEAEKWFDDVIKAHEETYQLMERSMYGKFFVVKGKVDIGDLISSKKANDCPFTLDLDEDILYVEVLGVSIEDARKRVEEYFEIVEWIDDEPTGTKNKRNG